MARSEQKLSELRVIAGRWRGRKIRFPADNIRPTGDRVRETLFNWLAPQLPGARCLDLFAGSGALGIEALSRGAGQVVFVERQAQAAAAIAEHLQTFGADPGTYTLLTTDALQLDIKAHGPFDVVFLDPPFRAAGGPELSNLCTLLHESQALAQRALVYLEMDRGDALPQLPPGWELSREKTAGQVRYALAELDLNRLSEEA